MHLCCCREQQCLWRKHDVEQRHLENARVLWARILERNRRHVEEKSEQLKAISTLAALISGFALTAFLQVGACATSRWVLCRHPVALGHLELG